MGKSNDCKHVWITKRVVQKKGKTFAFQECAKCSANRVQVS